MKNGVNIAGLSETAHEIRDYPFEAKLCYRGAATWDARGLLHARIGTITLGTTRVGRDFRVHCAPTPRAPGSTATLELLTPEEMFLAGAGACLLTTIVFGSSSKAHTLMEASILLAPAEPGQAWAYEYDVSIRGDMKPEHLIETLQESTKRSPSHRTLVESNALTWSLSEPQAQMARSTDSVSGPRDVAVAREGWPYASARRRAPPGRHLAIRWDYGLQNSFWPDSEVARQSRFPVDQPKQFGGMDRGPNPQEYLISGLAASVAETAGALARARDIQLQEVSCQVQGRVDLQGLLGLNPKIQDKIHDLTCALSFRGNVTPEQQAAIAKEAVETAEVARLLTRTNPSRVVLSRDGELLHELISAP